MIHSVLLSAALYSAPATPVRSYELTWTDKLQTALSYAQAGDKTVLAYVWSASSEACSKMYGETMAQADVARKMSEFVCLSADTGTDAGYALVERYGVRTLPTVLLIRADGELEDAVIGTIYPEGFLDELNRVQEGRDTISDFAERVAAAPEDQELRYAYAVKLQDCGNQEAYEQITSSIIERDPKGESLLAARLIQERAKKPIFEAAATDTGELDFADVDLTSFIRHVKAARHDELAFQGWAFVGEIERLRENHEAYRAAAMKAWPFAKDELVGDYAREVTYKFFEARDDLSRKEKKFVLKVASAAMERTEAYVAERTRELQESEVEGCASLAGCADGEGCGGCHGQKGKLVHYQVTMNETLACALFLNGKRKEAIARLEESLALSPGNEAITTRLTAFRAGT